MLEIGDDDNSVVRSGEIAPDAVIIIIKLLCLTKRKKEFAQLRALRAFALRAAEICRLG